MLDSAQKRYARQFKNRLGTAPKRCRDCVTVPGKIAPANRGGEGESKGLATRTSWWSAACQVRTSLGDRPILEFLEKESSVE
jgi:hypothetical protein